MGCRPNSQAPDGASWLGWGWGGAGFTPVSLLQMADIVEVSRTSTLELQNQLDEYKEKNRRELAEMQRQLKEKTLEAEKSRLTAMKLQDEVIMVDQSSPGLPVFRICFETLPGEAGVDSCFLFFLLPCHTACSIFVL